jgi:hypothetical protein
VVLDTLMVLQVLVAVVLTHLILQQAGPVVVVGQVHLHTLAVQLLPVGVLVVILEQVTEEILVLVELQEIQAVEIKVLQG